MCEKPYGRRERVKKVEAAALKAVIDMQSRSKTAEILERAEEVIRMGPYTDSWESLCGYKPPAWYQAVKFGIFVHWGPYSVPAFNSEWYSRTMYQEGSAEYAYHRQTYGPQDEFGYKEFIPLFTGEHFDADEWIALFKKAGARYVVPVAEHHDGFMMYQSALSKFTAVNMGPRRDVLREIKDACDKEGLILGVSNHRAEHYWFMEGARLCGDTSDPDFEEYYGPAMPSPCDWDGYGEPPELTQHMDDWLARCCELVERYKPAMVYFDWWIEYPAFKPYLMKFAAYYYNCAYRWGIKVVISYKHDAFALGSAVYDVERGKLSQISPRPWQCDTAVGLNSWGYTRNNQYKTAESIVRDLVDVISKNGCLLLNVGPRPDGTIAKEEADVLLRIGNWMENNREAVYGTTFWKIYGEGPCEVPEGTMTDHTPLSYTEEDIRFTYKNACIYAFVMQWTGKPVKIRALGRRSPHFQGQIRTVDILGFAGPIGYRQTEEALELEPVPGIQSLFPVVIKITIE